MFLVLGTKKKRKNIKNEEKCIMKIYNFHNLTKINITFVLTDVITWETKNMYANVKHKNKA